MVLSALRNVIFDWIPACAGMTVSLDFEPLPPPVLNSAPKLARQSLHTYAVQRKVRAPQSRMPVNDRTP